MRQHRALVALQLAAIAWGCTASAPGQPGPATSASAIPAQTTARAPAPSWLAFGDSITRYAFADPSTWLAAFAGAPPLVDAGVIGDTSQNALARVAAVLAAYPAARYVGIAFGTNDVSEHVTVDAYLANMRELVQTVQAAGKLAMLARIPYSPDPRLATVPSFNQGLDGLAAELHLPPGPDLYTAVKEHPDWLGPDQIHPSDAGDRGIQQAWAAAARSLVAPAPPSGAP